MLERSELKVKIVSPPWDLGINNKTMEGDGRCLKLSVQMDRWTSLLCKTMNKVKTGKTWPKLSSLLKETTGLVCDQRAWTGSAAPFVINTVSLCINAADRSAPNVAPEETGLTEPRR